MLPPLTISYSSIADHHLRDCVRAHTWGRGVCLREFKKKRETETGGTSASIFNLHGCELVLFSFDVG